MADVSDVKMTKDSKVKRDVTLADENGNEVNVTFWRDNVDLLRLITWASKPSVNSLYFKAVNFKADAQILMLKRKSEPGRTVWPIVINSKDSNFKYFRCKSCRVQRASIVVRLQLYPHYLRSWRSLWGRYTWIRKKCSVAERGPFRHMNLIWSQKLAADRTSLETSWYNFFFQINYFYFDRIKLKLIPDVKIILFIIDEFRLESLQAS